MNDLIIQLHFGEIKIINLVNDGQIFVTTSDYDWIQQSNWYGRRYGRGGPLYAKRQTSKRGTESIHRVILGLNPGDPRLGDHINGDTLDNRRSNLQIVTPRGNSANRKDKSKYGSGITKTPSGRFHVQVFYNGRTIYLGTFDSVKEGQKIRSDFVAQIETNTGDNTA